VTGVELPCPGGCGNNVPAERFACSTCWYRLPNTMRRRVARTWAQRRAGEPGATNKHMAAKAEATEWLANNPAASRG